MPSPAAAPPSVRPGPPSDPTRPGTRPRQSARLLPALGILYPVLTVLAFVAFPAPPGGDVSAAHDPGWLGAHLGPVTAQAFVRSVGALGFLLLCVAVSSWAARPWSRLLVACGAATATLLVLVQGAVLAAVLLTRARPGADLGVLDSLDAALLDLSSLPAVAVFGVAAAAFLGAGRGSRALGLLSLVGAPLALLDSLNSAGGPLAWFGLVGLMYFLFWSLLAGVFLLRRPLPAGMPPR